MTKFRKKPVVVEARWFDGRLHPDPDTDGMMEWFSKEDIVLAKWCGGDLQAQIDGWMTINTLEGVMKALPGDWIIKGVNGEFYPCKPDIFAETYEPAECEPTITVPLDAERVERAAEAIYDYLANSNDLDEMIGEVELQITDRESAKVALAAAGPEADWLDAALEDESFESPLHKAMGSWVTQDFLWRLNNEGEPGHEVAMQHARQAITNFLNAARNATALAAKQEGGER